MSGLGIEMMGTSLRSDQSNFEQEWRLSLKKKRAPSLVSMILEYEDLG